MGLEVFAAKILFGTFGIALSIASLVEAVAMGVAIGCIIVLLTIAWPTSNFR